MYITVLFVNKTTKNNNTYLFLKLRNKYTLCLEVNRTYDEGENGENSYYSKPLHLNYYYA